jgi:hypothetical protein
MWCRKYFTKAIERAELAVRLLLQAGVCVFEQQDELARLKRALSERYSTPPRGRTWGLYSDIIRALDRVQQAVNAHGKLVDTARRVAAEYEKQGSVLYDRPATEAEAAVAQALEALEELRSDGPGWM